MIMVENSTFSPFNPTSEPEQLSFETWKGLHGSADALAIVRFADSHNSPTVVLASNSRDAENLREALIFYCSGEKNLPISLFPGWECLPYDTFSPHPDIVSERIRLLYQLPYMGPSILVVSADNVMQRLPPVEYITSNSLALDIGQSIDTEKFRQHLIHCAYHCVDQVQSPGEFVYRGGIIDIFPMGSEEPVRIELFDTEIETLRFFSVDKQLSLRKVDSVRVLPGSEIPMDQKSIQRFRLGFRQMFDTDPRDNEIYRQIDSQIPPNGAEFYLPLFFDSTSLIFDYIPKSAKYFIAENFETSVEKFWKYAEERFEFARRNASRLPVPTHNLFCPPEQLKQHISSLQRVHIDNNSTNPNRVFNTKLPDQAQQNQHFRKFESSLFQTLKQSKSRTLITLDDSGQREIVETALRGLGLEYSRVENWHEFLADSCQFATSMANLPSGLNLPEDQLRILTSGELLGYRGQVRKQADRRRNPESIINSMQELKIGEPVVHEQYGIGLYQGLVTMHVAEYPSEFLKIKYLGNENLYVSVHNVDCISRYLGGNSEDIEPHSLSSKSWNASKRKARQQAFDIAAELLAIQSLRDVRKGNNMPLPVQDYQEFVSRFQYAETHDQKHAIESVLSDLESDRPMDRLVCGDVGFGKTEVALRAALVAVANGFQVAVVVPTRPLAQQHYDVFLDRFSDMGVHIQLLSNMQQRSVMKIAVDNLKQGEIDIVIGTHRLLQSDINFKNLGLVIIDEEHRFGVRQKESLKKLRADVDILTLTATPIPRTLSMALNKLRDISIISTPPDNRLSVRTFVKNWNPELVREACMRELRRGGQIFYVFNDVKTIRRVTEEISRIVPEARINYAHGQMSKIRLDKVMKDFYMRKFDLLVCTTIIESGIDIATANTIIVDRAYKFGLAQLHQLRGRVGRSHHQAYAYLLVPSTESLRSNARRRLEAIEAFDQLGVGYIIATHDLEIRGAGALLGEAQSGVVNEIGYSIYTRYLNDAISALENPSRTSTVDDDLPLNNHDVEIDLDIPALIPETWIQNVNHRLVLYRKIAAATNEHELTQIKSEMRDRFGRLPEEVTLLFTVKALKLKTIDLGLIRLRIQKRTGHIVFSGTHNVNVFAIRNLISDYPGTVRRIDTESRLEFTHRLNSAEERIERAFFIVKILTMLPEHSNT